MDMMSSDAEERKRSIESSEPHEPKKMRPEEILGLADKRCVARLLLAKHEFSKIIGKGGATISHIRNTYGASVKGTDVDAETRLVIITGTPRQVLDAFDVVAELMYQSYSQQVAQMEPFALQFLLEHNKQAGRAVGPKGATIQAIKMKSGASQIRIQKDPIDFNGVLLRVMTIEGSLQAVKRAHFHLQELFVDPSQLAGGVQSQPSYGNYGDVSLGGKQWMPLPLSSLTSLGVQGETVRQLTEMKVYLLRQFGLDLSISKEVPVPTPSFSGGAMNSLGYAGQPFQAPRVHGPGEVTFMIPSSSVGGIIGKGGQLLKDLQAEFGIKIYIEKEVPGSTSGMRTVVLASQSSTGESGLSEADRHSMLQCQERITAMILANDSAAHDTEGESTDYANLDLSLGAPDV